MFNGSSTSTIRSLGFYVADDGVLTLIECEFARSDTYSCARYVVLPTQPTVQSHKSIHIFMTRYLVLKSNTDAHKLIYMCCQQLTCQLSRGPTYFWIIKQNVFQTEYFSKNLLQFLLEIYIPPDNTQKGCCRRS